MDYISNSPPAFRGSPLEEGAYITSALKWATVDTFTYKYILLLIGTAYI